MSPYVFLSHSSKNESVTDVICKSLEAGGIRCWLSSRDIPPGANWGEAIIDGINASRVMVVILTADSNKSQHVVREVERAVNFSIPIIPIRIDDIPLSKSLEYFLSMANWLDAFTPPLQGHLDILLDRVSSLFASHEDQSTVAADLFARAKEHRAAYNYASAIETIETVPEQMRNTEMIAYLGQLESDRDESDRLIELIKERIQQRRFSGLLEEVNRAIELRGDREDLFRLQSQLEEQGQSRRAHSQEERYQREQALKERREHKIASTFDANPLVTEDYALDACEEMDDSMIAGSISPSEEPTTTALTPVSWYEIADIDDPPWLIFHLDHLAAMETEEVEEWLSLVSPDHSLEEWAQSVRDSGTIIQTHFESGNWKDLLVLYLEGEYYRPFMNNQGDFDEPEESPLDQMFEELTHDFQQRFTQDGESSWFSNLSDEDVVLLVEEYPQLVGGVSDDGASAVGCLMSVLVPIIYGIWGFKFAAAAVVVSGIIGALVSRDGNRGEGMGAALGMSAGLGTAFWWLWKAAALGYTWVAGWFG